MKLTIFLSIFLGVSCQVLLDPTAITTDPNNPTVNTDPTAVQDPTTTIASANPRRPGGRVNPNPVPITTTTTTTAARVITTTTTTTKAQQTTTQSQPQSQVSSTSQKNANDTQTSSSKPSSTNILMICGLIGGVVLASILGIYIFRKTTLRKSNAFEKRLDPKYAPTLKQVPKSNVPKLDEYIDGRSSPQPTPPNPSHNPVHNSGGIPKMDDYIDGRKQSVPDVYHQPAQVVYQHQQYGYPQAYQYDQYGYQPQGY